MSAFRRIPPIKRVMTPFPFAIDVDDPLESAQSMMRERGFRHLPVTDGDSLVGILSERDIHIARSVRAEGSAAGEPVKVRAACTRTPYVVDLNEPLDEVVMTMASKQIGSALITRQGRLAGILTTTDVCRLLGELLRELDPTPQGDDVA